MSQADIQRHEFFTALFSRDWTPELYTAACYGYVMREHVEQEHPGQHRDVELKVLLRLPAAKHEAWTFGYRYIDGGKA